MHDICMTCDHRNDLRSSQVHSNPSTFISIYIIKESPYGLNGLAMKASLYIDIYIYICKYCLSLNIHICGRTACIHACIHADYIYIHIYNRGLSGNAPIVQILGIFYDSMNIYNQMDFSVLRYI